MPTGLPLTLTKNDLGLSICPGWHFYFPFLGSHHDACHWWLLSATCMLHSASDHDVWFHAQYFSLSNNEKSSSGLQPVSPYFRLDEYAANSTCNNAGQPWPLFELVAIYSDNDLCWILTGGYFVLVRRVTTVSLRTACKWRTLLIKLQWRAPDFSE